MNESFWIHLDNEFDRGWEGALAGDFDPPSFVIPGAFEAYEDGWDAAIAYLYALGMEGDFDD